MKSRRRVSPQGQLHSRKSAPSHRIVGRQGSVGTFSSWHPKDHLVSRLEESESSDRKRPFPQRTRLVVQSLQEYMTFVYANPQTVCRRGASLDGNDPSDGYPLQPKRRSDRRHLLQMTQVQPHQSLFDRFHTSHPQIGWAP